MKIVLFRHAERENLGLQNPPLSRRGFQQAEKLVQLVQTKQLPIPNKICSSPKLRSQMTFSKISQSLNLSLQSFAELDERVPTETSDQFSKRVKSSLHKFTQLGGTTGVIFLCTHVDWIEMALIHIPSNKDLSESQYQNWLPGSYMTFEVISDLWHFEKWGVIEI